MRAGVTPILLDRQGRALSELADLYRDYYADLVCFLFFCFVFVFVCMYVESLTILKNSSSDIFVIICSFFFAKK